MAPFKPITVAQLRAQLAEADPNDIVIVSSDAEGNDFRCLYQVDFGWARGPIQIGRHVNILDEDEKGSIPITVLWPA